MFIEKDATYITATGLKARVNHVMTCYPNLAPKGAPERKGKWTFVNYTLIQTGANKTSIRAEFERCFSLLEPAHRIEPATAVAAREAELVGVA